MRESVIVDGVKYIREVETEKNYCIVRTARAGVFAGHLADDARKGQELVLTDARRLWSWSGAASLSQLAMDGVADPVNCKFPCAVPSITLLEVIEIIPCSAKAKTSIEGVPTWKR